MTTTALPLTNEHGTNGHAKPSAAEPSDFTKRAMDLLGVLWEPKLDDLRRRCAEAAAKAAPGGPLAVKAAVEAVALEAPEQGKGPAE